MTGHVLAQELTWTDTGESVGVAFWVQPGSAAKARERRVKRLTRKRARWNMLPDNSVVIVEDLLTTRLTWTDET